MNLKRVTLIAFLIMPACYAAQQPGQEAQPLLEEEQLIAHPSYTASSISYGAGALQIAKNATIGAGVGAIFTVATSGFNYNDVIICGLACGAAKAHSIHKYNNVVALTHGQSIFGTAYQGDNEGLQKWLALDSNNWNLRDSERNTVVHYAALGGYPNTAQLLKRLGDEKRKIVAPFLPLYADQFDMENFQKRTPIMIAALAGKYAMVKTLKEMGVKLEVPDINHQTVVSLAQRNQYLAQAISLPEVQHEGVPNLDHQA